MKNLRCNQELDETYDISDGSARLQIGDGPVPRPSSITLKEFGDLWVADAKRQFSLRPKSPSPDEKTQTRA